MPYTVNSCFEKFRSEVVDLDSTRSTTALVSRNNLMTNIDRLSEKGRIPVLYPERHIAFGSFARKTKISPLDDIDLMIAIHGQGGHYSVVRHNAEYHIFMPDETPVLGDLIEDGNLNSRRVVNKFRDNLSDLNDYRRAELHRNQEAVTLQLRSYEWNFDIVPCFYTRQGFYLIPDGNGAWKPSNPTIDGTNVTRANQNYDGQLLKLIRLMKYWKRKNRISTISSYTFEVMIINYVQGKQFYQLSNSVSGALRYLSTNAMGIVQDPKGFQGDLNCADFTEKYRIAQIAQRDAYTAMLAVEAESNRDHRTAIGHWQEIFGDEFLGYGV